MKEFIQESLEAELDSELGYEKYEKKRIVITLEMGILKRKLNLLFGEIELNIHAIETVNSSLKLFQNIRVISLT